jgi:hypothetical protein
VHRFASIVCRWRNSHCIGHNVLHFCTAYIYIAYSVDRPSAGVHHYWSTYSRTVIPAGRYSIKHERKGIDPSADLATI